MLNILNIRDAQQQALGFLVSQTSSIEAEVYRIAYPEIQYPILVPVDTSANEWAKSITFFSVDKVGQAKWFHHLASDMPKADIARQKYEKGIEMAGIGYGYSLEEIGQAMMIPGLNLGTERADAARRAYEEFLDRVVLLGDTTKNWTGLLNDASVTILEAAASAGADAPSPAWSSKTPAEIITDVNNLLSGVYGDSLQIELANTLLLPISEFTRLATLQMTNLDMTVLDWIKKYNVYTAQTGQQLTVRGIRGLDDAGENDVGRAVAYNRDPRVLKLHLPMPHRFLPVWQTSPLGFDVPGIFRTGGVEIRRPGAVRYLDNIIDPAYS